MSSSLRVDVWSDVVCPWCYLGKRRLEAALARLPADAPVEVVWRSFELDPSSPREQPREVSHAERLARKYGMTVKQATERTAHLAALASAEGLTLNFEQTRPGNTFDAHRLLHLAKGVGLQGTLKERFMHAYFTEGEPIGDREVLVRLAGEVGLDEETARAALGTDQHAADVRADERLASDLGIHGVPCFVVAGRYAVSGAQPADQIEAVLKRALGEQGASAPAATTTDGDACGPDGC